MEKFNPFKEYGITTYEQYKQFPFLVFGTLNLIINDIKGQINNIKNKVLTVIPKRHKKGIPNVTM